MLRFSGKFLPFECALLGAFHDALPSRVANHIAQQIACINKIQRLLEWHEIEFYSLRWFKPKWPEHLRFGRTDEFTLATLGIESSVGRQEIAIWAVSGRLFSLESDLPMKPLRNLKDVVVSQCVISPETAALAI